MLAILKVLIKWEDKLIRQKVHVITDPKALKFFKTQCNLSNRQCRWMDYMSKSNFNITYVKGKFNKVADCLSHYYESNTNADIHEFHECIQADRRINSNGEDLPNARRQEIKKKWSKSALCVPWRFNVAIGYRKPENIMKLRRQKWNRPTMTNRTLHWSQGKVI